MEKEGEILDMFRYLVEGVFLVIKSCSSEDNFTFSQVLFGLLGVIGNLLCIIIFTQKIAQKSFHHLMLCLAIFDLLYILMSIMLFGLPTLYPE